MDVYKDYAANLLEKIAEGDQLHDITLVAGINERRYDLNFDVCI